MPLINWVTFINSYGSNLFTYGEIPNKTASTLLSVIHQSSMSSSHVIKSIYFGKEEIISFQTIFDAKNDDIFIYSIIMCTTVQDDDLNQLIFNLIVGMTKLKVGAIEEKHVHDDKENFKKRINFLHHVIEELNTTGMETWIPYPKFQHFFQTRKISNVITDQFGDLPIGVYYNGNFWMGNDDWISQSMADLKLIQMFIKVNPMETCRDIPIYLREGKRSVRLLTVKINDNIDIFLLAAAKPSIKQLVSFLRSNEWAIQEWISKDPVSLTDGNIIEFLFINHETGFYVHEKSEDILKDMMTYLKKFTSDSYLLKHKNYIVQYLRLRKKEVYCVAKTEVDLRDLLN